MLRKVVSWLFGPATIRTVSVAEGERAMREAEYRVWYEERTE